jgi:hypothetical protein
VSFLTGQTKQTSNVNGSTEGLDKSLIEWITGQGFKGLNPGTQVDEASIAPYRKMFEQNNALNFAQAKESVGNLTGSGLGNTIGTAAARGNAEQGSFLANLFENRRQQDANRFLSLIMGTLGSPAGGVATSYQPGFLDYAGQGATALAGGGAFNGLFKRAQ